MADDTQGSPGARPSVDAGQDPLLGIVIQDRFKILSLIARGPIACTYQAEIIGEQRPCALKVVEKSPGGIDPLDFRKRFLLDTSAAARLTHPNTATVLASGTLEDRVFLAMEFLDGRTLHRALREEGALPEDRLLHIARQIARSVREAHGLGIVHRDLRPGNVMLMQRDHEQDFVKVVDFGLFREANEASGRNISREGAFLGSAKHMAPEQILGDPIDARTDIYAFGVILYEMATGKVPFDGKNAVRILQAQLDETPAPLSSVKPDIQVSAQLEEVVMRCLQKSPDLRYGSMDQLLDALKAGAASVSTLATPPPGPALAAIAPPGTTPIPPRPRTSKPPPPPPEPEPAEGAPSQPPVPAARIKAMLAKSDGVTTVLSEREQAEARKVPQNLLALIGGAAIVVGLAAAAAYAIRLADSPSADATVRVESSPPGATVRSEQGEPLCASTPCDVTLTSAHLEEGRTIIVARAGYREEAKLIRSSDGKVLVTLARLP